MQRSGSLLIDQNTPYLKLENDLEAIGKMAGDITMGFLSLVGCEGNNELGCTIEEYEKSPTVVYRGVTFKVSSEDIPLASVVASALIKKTKERLAFYLQIDDMKALRIFNPDSFSSGSEAQKVQDLSVTDEETSFRVHGVKEMKVICKKLGVNFETVVSSWAGLVKSMLLSKH